MKRRNAIAAVTAAGMAVAAGIWRFTDIIVKHYPPTPYDDLLRRLDDREQATRLGARVRAAGDAAQLAPELRAALSGRDLSAALDADIAAGRLMEIDGWVLPETLTLLAALASKV